MREIVTSLTWEIALQTFSAGLAAMAAWFLFELVKEYKKFRETSGEDIKRMTLEREVFKIGVDSALLKLTELRQSTEHSVKSINHDMRVFQTSIMDLRKESDKAVDFMKKNYILSKVLHDKVDILDKDLRALKDDLGKE
jgi:hypothetical protein